MTIGLAHALRVLVAIGLFFTPLAPMNAYCATTDIVQTDPVTARYVEQNGLTAAPGHDCCVETDQADLDGNIDLSVCQVGCIAIPGMTGTAQFVMTQLVVVAEASFADRVIADWSPQPLYDPPILRS